MEFTLSTPEELTEDLKDEKKIQEFCNYVIFEGITKPKAFHQTFRVDYPLSNTHTMRMYRWMKRDNVVKWLTKANKSLEVDWIDKRVNALQHLYDIGTNEEEQSKVRVDALDKFLGKLDKEQNKLLVDIGQPQQVNIIQIVQDKLSQITGGAMITPDGNFQTSHKSIAAEIVADKAKA